MNLNLVQICGRMTADPEAKTLPTGTMLAKFSVASNRNWKDKSTGQKKEEVEFHNVVAFGRTAEVIVQYFNRGDEIYIQGRLKTSSWEDQQGSKRYRTEIIAEKFEFGQKSKANAERSNQNAPQENYNDPGPAQETTSTEKPEDEIKIEDIPF